LPHARRASRQAAGPLPATEAPFTISFARSRQVTLQEVAYTSLGRVTPVAEMWRSTVVPNSAGSRLLRNRTDGPNRGSGLIWWNRVSRQQENLAPSNRSSGWADFHVY
jgi:hypothetical protein